MTLPVVPAVTLLSASKVAFEGLRSLAFGSISSSYAAVGGPFLNPIRILKVSNGTNANLLISFDGLDAQDFVSAGGFALYDYNTNKTDQSGWFQQSLGTQLYVKLESGSATSGSVYVTVIYGSK